MPKLCSFGCIPSGVTMHRFPNAVKYPERFKSWVDSVGGKLETMSDYEYYQNKVICDKHFTAQDRTRHNRLNALAVPTLNTPEKSVAESEDSDSVLPSSLLASGTGIVVEHNYSKASRSIPNTTVKGIVTIGAETEADDGDVKSSIDSPPSKKHARSSLGLEMIYKNAPDFFEQYKQDWEENNSVTVNISSYTAQQRTKMVQNRCQNTEKSTYDDVEKSQAANKAFGSTVGLKLEFVPILKRRYVMDEIIKIINRNSK